MRNSHPHMIKFFRRIRKNLLSENRFSKYLLYAIGEIVLVVVGILIALQINNWNEDRAALKYQNVVLDEIRRALEGDIQSYRDNLDILKEVDSGITGIVYLLGKEPKTVTTSEFYEAANKTVLDISFDYNSGPYEGLKSTGLEKIKNPMLRSSIISYYEITLKNIQREIEEGTAFFDQQQRDNREMMAKEGVFESRFIHNQDSLVSIGLRIDPEKILAHERYPDYLKNIMWEGAGHRKQLNLLVEQAESLIQAIRNELNR